MTGFKYKMIAIGPYALENKVFLAPMAGVTDLPFRKLCKSFGAAMTTGEMTASNPVLRCSAKSRLRGVHLDEPTPRSIQIVGWCPEMMADAARYNADQGASVIDINMGCPAKKVCRKAAGSALLSDPGQVARILDAVVQAVDLPVTLKIRTGIDRNHRNGVEIAHIAQECGIQLLAVHGRTRADLYTGQSEYETIRQIKIAVSIPVIANGDLDSFGKIRSVLEYTGCDGIMIGRAAHGAPWFPGEVGRYLESGYEPKLFSLDRQYAVVLDHLKSIYEFYGDNKGVRIARKHIKWYVQSLPGSTDFRTIINSVETPDLQLKMVDDFYCGILNTSLAA